MALSDTSVIIAAAGNASRMGGTDKLLADLCGKSVIAMSISAFEQAPSVAEIIIVTKEKNIPQYEMIVASSGAKKVSAIVAGGETRQQSVINGLKATSSETKFIAVHDGARPLVRTELIEKTIADARVFGGATLGVPVKDTVKIVDGGLITDTPDRSRLYLIQTPQVFKKALYYDGVNFAAAHNLDFTDDCQLVEAVCGKIAVTIGDYQNIKITTPEDLLISRAICGRNNMRIGHGYDVHRLVPERKLILGGEKIPYERGLLGHSDADVLVHAVMDSLLGALALGDIGKLFPDNDEKYNGADSIKLLCEVMKIVRGKGFSVGNIDATIICQSPKLSPYIDKMRNNIALSCNTDISRISVKATTEEHLGFTGSGEGIAAHAVCILEED